jgi:uncharacterized membrane protein
VSRLAFGFAQLRYEVGARLLALPGLLAAGLGGFAFALQALEARGAVVVPLAPIEPATAQAILATLAGSTMTLVSVVYSVLLVALSLASTQFSTRILAGMVRDRFAHVVLGLFLGSFVWQLVALRGVHVDPPYVAPLTTSLAIVLAAASLLALVAFIDRLIRGLQANHIVDRIATETEAIIDEVFAARPGDGARASVPEPASDAARVRAKESGYVQLVDLEGALELARDRAVVIQLLRPMGAFVPEGVALWAVSPASRCTPELEAALRDAVDLGEVRTMQEDVEWGLRQIVDIGLKAISPAVNDPSTGALCIDHLARLLIRAGRGAPPPSVRIAGEGRLVVPVSGLVELVDLAFDQLRQYGRTDMAIALRLLRAIADVAECVSDSAARARLAVHAREVVRAARTHFSAVDLHELEHRLARIEDALGPVVGAEEAG